MYKKRPLNLKNVKQPNKRVYVVWYPRQHNFTRVFIQEGKNYMPLMYYALNLSRRYPKKQYSITFFEWDENGTIIRDCFISTFKEGNRVRHFPL